MPPSFSTAAQQCHLLCGRVVITTHAIDYGGITIIFPHHPIADKLEDGSLSR